MDESNVFGKRVLELRSEYKVTLEEVANFAGITKSVLSKYERGIHEPGLMVAKRIADFFHVSMDYIIGSSDERRPGKNLLSDLDENTREEVMKYIEFRKSISKEK